MKRFIVTLVSLSLILSAPYVAARDGEHKSKNREHRTHQRDSHQKDSHQRDNRQSHNSHQRHKQNHQDHKKNHKPKHHTNQHRGQYNVHHNRHQPVYRSKHRSSHHGKHRSSHHGKHHSKHHNHGGYLLGGLLLGAAINEWATPSTTVVKETVYVDRGSYPVQQQTQDFIKDEQGRCYSVEYKQNGRVLTEVPREVCY